MVAFRKSLAGFIGFVAVATTRARASLSFALREEDFTRFSALKAGRRKKREREEKKKE